MKRKARIRARAFGTKGRPRLSIFRSNKGIYAQIIDDTKGATLVSFSSKKLDTKKIGRRSKSEIAQIIGEEFAKLARKKKITSVVFDRGGYKYHGRVKALAEGARKGGLKF